MNSKSNPKSLPDESQIRALAGHRFPGGTYTIAHWENFLLTQCTGSEPLPGDLAHPVALFHVPILGANTSIAEMFALGQAETDFAVGIESYDWQIFKPLREDVRYRVEGTITEADRRQTKGRTFDRIQFKFDLHEPEDALAATTIITWHYRRTST
jgi:hypothetical protein